jgi:hypothetical protein
MRKFYSFVLMAAALLIGTNAWAKTWKVAQVEGEGIDFTSLSDAFAAAASGDVIQLQSQMTLSSYIWIGEADQAATSGTGKVLTLDLNGEQLSYTGDKPFIQLTHGTLTIKTSQAGGKIYSNRSGKAAESVILVTGSTLKDCKPKTQTNYYSHLVIENGVEIEAQKNAVVIDGTPATSVQGTLTYTTNVYKASNKPSVAHGVRVDVYGKLNAYKYGLKVNGLVTKPTTDGVTPKVLNTTNDLAGKVPAGYTIAATDVDYIPFIYIANGAELKANETANESTGLYCAGYANYLIEGYVHGSTGVYIKSGNVEIAEGSKIESDNDNDTGIKVTGKGSGLDAGGNAVSVESNTNSYAGDINVTISGGTITAGDHGQSVQNTNANGAGAVQAVVISGGTFTGGAAGAITLDPNSTPTNVQLTGGTFTGSIDDLVEAVGENNVITQVVSVDPVTHEATVVVGQKEAGDEIVDLDDDEKQKDFAFVNDMANDIVNLNADALTGNLSKTLPDGTTEVKYLSLTGEDNYTVTVTVEDGKILKVGQVVMNGNGRIIVKAGGQLIITGNNGLFADAIENIILETSSDKQAIFLFNPEVGNNRHPKATVEFLSKSYRQDSKNVYQRFGFPTYNNEVTLEYANPASSAQTYITNWDYAADGWASWIAVPAAGGLNVTVASPFACFDMASNNAKAEQMRYIFKGALVGNYDGEMSFNSGFNPYSNSYMAPIDIESFLTRLVANYGELEGSLRVYQSFANDNYRWRGISLADFEFGTPDITKIAPMQAYMLKLNEGSSYSATVSYKDNVYDPFTAAAAAPAPARAKAAKTNYMNLNIANENGVVCDDARLIEDNRFSNEFDNGYDVTKYMNDEVNMYVNAEEALSTMASDDLQNAFINVNVAESGVYTLNVTFNGLDYALVDLDNNKVIELVEGNSYEFFQEAGKNEARFQLVKVNKVPTAMENIEENTISTKFMKDGVMYILKNGAVYNAQGQIVK